jgi:hypothetical protein
MIGVTNENLSDNPFEYYLGVLYFHFALPSIRCRYVEDLKCYPLIKRIGFTMATLTKAIENCKNPWKGKCKNTDIEVYIYYRNKRLPICRKCWGIIAEKDIEW